MEERLSKIITRFSGCYYVTRSLRQSLIYALKLGNNKISTLKMSKTHSIHLRKNESDQEVFLTTFVDQYHRSHIHLGTSPVILDLGCNIGLTMVDFKQEYPSATVIGVEMDKDNYDTCRTNISGLTNCSLLHAAIWKENGTIDYQGENEQSYAVEISSFGQNGKVRCITMDTLLKENNIQDIDYIKMDIEGAEKAIFLDSNSKQWLSRVRYISIEVHDYPEMNNLTLEKNLKAELEANQFIVYKSAKHWSSLFGINKLLHS